MSSKARYAVLALVLAAAVAAAGALAYHFYDGARYRLYTNELAGDCWRAVELTTLETSTLRPVAVAAPVRASDGSAHVSIDYTMDRVLGGSTLNVTCGFAADDRLASVEFDGIALDPGTLADVERELAN